MLKDNRLNFCRRNSCANCVSEEATHICNLDKLVHYNGDILSDYIFWTLSAYNNDIYSKGRLEDEIFEVLEYYE